MILDCIGGRNWESNVSSLAIDGRWVLYGTMGGRAVEGDLLGKLLSKRGHLLTSLLRSRSLQVRIENRSDTTAVFLHLCADSCQCCFPLLGLVAKMRQLAWVTFQTSLVIYMFATGPDMYFAFSFHSTKLTW